MTRLKIVRSFLIAKRDNGAREFGFVQLAEEISQQTGMIYQDTVRKYLRDLLAAEIPTEKVKKGVYRFITQPRQGRLLL